MRVERSTASAGSRPAAQRPVQRPSPDGAPVGRVREPLALPYTALSRHIGNHATARLAASYAQQRAPAGTPSHPSLGRFESMEHKKMGDIGSGGAAISLGPGITVSFGDVTALAGDYFESVEQMKTLASIPGSPAEPYSVQGSVDEVKYALYVEVQKTMKAEQFDEGVVNAAKKRYFNLAAQNVSHFSNPEAGDELLTHDERARKGKRNNAGSYRGNHELAIDAAVEAGTGQCGPLDDAMLYEAFGSHFLTDAFSAGHLRTPRASIGEWWNPKVPMFWHNLKLWLAEWIAWHMNENSTLASVLTINELWKRAIATLEGVMAAKGMPDLQFGDAISGALHDFDNEKGVEAQVGDQFVTLVGDGEVLDSKDRELVRGAETMKLAAASVKVSLKDVHDAYDLATQGMTAAEVKAQLMTPDGLFRAEQLWPQALPDSQVANPSLKWQVDSVDDLFKDPRIREALTIFAHGKAGTLGSEVSLDPPLRLEKEAALAWTLEKLKGDESSVINVFKEIIDYTPGLPTAGSAEGEGELTGVFGDESDDNALAYYNKAKATPNGLLNLSVAQRTRLIRLVLDGPTGMEEELMIIDLLMANPFQLKETLDAVTWRRCFEDIDGPECVKLIDWVGPLYWPKQSYEKKRDEVGWLADGSTGERSEEAIIVILRTCTPAEVQRIDDEVGGRLGLSFDLDGAEQDEFDKLKAGT